MKTSQKTFTLLSLTSLAALLSSCSSGHDTQHEKTHPQREPVSIRTTISKVETVRLVSETTGTIRARNRASIAPKVTGEIAAIHVVTGQKVSRQELLVNISALEITSKLQSAQANVDKVRRDLLREEDLLVSGASTPELVNDLRDQLRIAEAMASEAQTMLSYTEIRTPFDGYITRKYAHEGDLAMPGQPLLEIEDLTSLRVEADLPEILGVQVELGMQLEIEVTGLDPTLTGTVEEIAPAADPRSRTFPVKISLPANDAVRSGQFAKVHIPTREVQAVLVDHEAIDRWGQMERVFVVEEGHLRMRIVKTGARHGDQIEVISGLQGGESLAIRMDAPLFDGSPVR